MEDIGTPLLDLEAGFPVQQEVEVRRCPLFL